MGWTMAPALPMTGVPGVDLAVSHQGEQPGGVHVSGGDELDDLHGGSFQANNRDNRDNRGICVFLYMSSVLNSKVKQ
jgi:hypothetical protein